MLESGPLVLEANRGKEEAFCHPVWLRTCSDQWRDNVHGFVPMMVMIVVQGPLVPHQELLEVHRRGAAHHLYHHLLL
jgi:hypothetical protein